MNKFNIVLLKLPALYEILNEIKLELNFNFINFKEKNDQFKKYIEENPEVLIISPDSKANYKNFISYNKVFYWVYDSKSYIWCRMFLGCRRIL